MKNLHFTEISFSEAIKRGEDFFEEANGQHMLSDFKAERIPMGGGYNSYQVTFVLDGLGVAFKGSDKYCFEHLEGPIFFEADDIEVVEPQKVIVSAPKSLRCGGWENLFIENMEGEEILYINFMWGRYSTLISISSPKMKKVKTFSFDLW